MRDFIIDGTLTDELDLLVIGLGLERLAPLLGRYGAAQYVGRSFGVIKFAYSGHTFDIAIPEIRHSDGETGDILTADAQNRDFTIDSLMLGIPNGELIDVVGGLTDIEHKVLRTYSAEYFVQDPVRALRALRLRNKLGFALDKTVYKLVKSLGERLKSVASERIGDEIRKILLLPKPGAVFRDMAETGLLAVILPELNKCRGVTQPGGWHAYDVFEHTMRALDASDSDLILRLAILFHDVGKPDKKVVPSDGRARFYGHERVSANVARRRLSEFAFSNEIVASVVTIIKSHMVGDPHTDRGLRRLIRRVGKENILRWADMRIADLHGMNLEKPSAQRALEGQRALKARIEEELLCEPPLSVRDLAVNGNDVMAELGIEEGPAVGRVLDTLLERVLDNPSLNERNRLIEIIRREFG